ncbi:hypothetical protein DPD44_22440 [Salmonella enterica subsp. enterica serovar Poona]|nr:hypothetical protein [Salmonella enterica subsp. enterica serovar Poona]
MVGLAGIMNIITGNQVPLFCVCIVRAHKNLVIMINEKRPEVSLNVMNIFIVFMAVFSRQ